MQIQTYSPSPLTAAEAKSALELIVALARADVAVLFVHDSEHAMLAPAMAVGLDDERLGRLGLSRAGLGPVGTAVAERRRVTVRDAANADPSISALTTQLGVRSLEIEPLIDADGRAVGAIAMMFRRAHSMSEWMTKLVEHCASLAAVAVSHAAAHATAERARERAECVAQTRSEFLVRMSHELRTPLQSIAGYIDLLREGAPSTLTPAQRRLLARLHDSETVLARLVDDLLTFSRLESGHVTYHIGTVVVQDALRITESVIAPLAIQHGVTLRVADGGALLATADGDKLKQILVNLAANAVKFCGSAGAVAISCAADGNAIRFDFTDTGPGIPADRLADIFEPYVQVNRPMHERAGGFGLGLAISREFAAGMHGELTATSTLGHGSVFTLRLPRASLPLTRAQVPAPRETESAA